MKEAGDQLGILRKISKIIAAVPDPSEVLARIVKILADSLEIEVCNICRYVEESDELVLAATCGLSQDLVNRIRLRAGEGLTGACFKQHKMINVVNPSAHPEYVYIADTGEEEFNSLLAVPLTAGGRCVGTISFQSRTAKEFSRPVVDMVQSLSTQLAHLILNADVLHNLNAKQEARGPRVRKGRESLMFRGIAASDGLAQGRALLFESRDLLMDTEHATHSDTEKELALFSKAVELARGNTIDLEYRALSMLPEADASIFNSHLLFLDDRNILDEIKNEIVKEKHSLDFAVAVVYRRFEKKFLNMEDPVFRDRRIDFKDVMLRLVEAAKFLRRELDDRRQAVNKKTAGKWILVADDLLPSDLLRLPLSNIAGIVCAKGGVTSHVAIIARAFKIPALLSVCGVIEKVSRYDELLLDCHAEMLFVNPMSRIRRKYKEMLGAVRIDKPGKCDNGPVKTLDGQEVFLRANISLICETSLLERFGACGIGLYRSEFLFMIRDYLPSEDAQFRVFSKIMQDSNGEVTMRVLDAGGDKMLPCLSLKSETNPALGLRGVRLLLQRPEILRPHLRAVLRAGRGGMLKILFPMVSRLTEIIAIREFLKTVEAELRQENIPYAEDYKIGIMLEVPSVLMGIDAFLKYVDFMSIGTNDLMQYTFASDRSGFTGGGHVGCMDPIFIRMLAKAGAVFGGCRDKNLAICGEMAGIPMAVPLLVGSGIYDLSMSPGVIPGIRKVISSFSVDECRELVKEAIKLETPFSVDVMMARTFREKGLDAEVSAFS